MGKMMMRWSICDGRAVNIIKHVRCVRKHQNVVAIKSSHSNISSEKCTIFPVPHFMIFAIVYLPRGFSCQSECRCDCRLRMCTMAYQIDLRSSIVFQVRNSVPESGHSHLKWLASQPKSCLRVFFLLCLALIFDFLEHPAMQIFCECGRITHRKRCKWGAYTET